MNFAPTLSMGMAVFMSLFAASLWGTWFISLKHLGDYPLEGFYMTLFSASLIFVWTAGFIIDRGALLSNISELWGINKLKIIITLLGGLAYVMGMYIQLQVMQLIGLTLSQPLTASVGFIISNAIVIFIGGRPQGLSLGRILLSLMFLFIAIILAFFIQRIKTAAQNQQHIDTGLSRDPAVMKKAILLVILGTCFSPGYSLALAYGLKTITQEVGLGVMPFMCLLCSGAFIGAFVTSGIALTRKKQWGQVFSAPWSIHRWGLMSGLFHYGGNILHTFASGALSTAVSWPLGLTSGIWTQIWGLRYGEFKGAPKLAYVLQVACFCCYILGAFFIVFR